MTQLDGKPVAPALPHGTVRPAGPVSQGDYTCTSCGWALRSVDDIAAAAQGISPDTYAALCTDCYDQPEIRAAFERLAARTRAERERLAKDAADLDKQDEHGLYAAAKAYQVGGNAEGPEAERGGAAAGFREAHQDFTRNR